MSEISVGQRAPSFRLPSAHGDDVGLGDYRGWANVLLFFAKGMACGFCRQKMSQLARGAPQFRALDTKIVMVTPTPLARARFYGRRFDLPFPYLSDPDYQVARAYGLERRPHSLAWKAQVAFHASRLPQPENDFGPPKPTLREVVRVLNDDDLGLFIVDKDGVLRYASHAAYVTFEGAKPVGMHPIPSNDEIVAELERCEGRASKRRSA